VRVACDEADRVGLLARYVLREQYRGAREDRQD
jgi:hypothetical protein